MAAQSHRRRGQHGVTVLSRTTRQRLLKALLERAEGGDVPAIEAVIRLSLEQERAATATAAPIASLTPQPPSHS